MLNEIEVIAPSGVPIYYHHNEGNANESLYLLQASFITALTSFASELQNGEVKLISMEKKNYLLKKSNTFTIIFTNTEAETEQIMTYTDQLESVSDYIDKKLLDYNLSHSEIDVSKYDPVMNDLSGYLSENQLILGKDTYDASSFRAEVRSLIFKSVGYEPGKCNIGRAERFRRLNFGLVFFLLSFIGYVSVSIFSLPSWTILFLAVPNFLGFLGFFQYFYRFCTTNAMSEQYDMN